MYHACLDPFSDFNIPFLPHTTNNLVHVMILAIDLLNLAFNLFLFKFLEKQRENNTGLSAHSEITIFFLTITQLVSQSTFCHRHEKGETKKFGSSQAYFAWIFSCRIQHSGCFFLYGLQGCIIRNRFRYLPFTTI